MSWVLWAAALFPVLVLLMALLNLATWPRGRRDKEAPETISVLIPARNEAASIEACVRAALQTLPSSSEVIVYDDASTDATPEILGHMAAVEPRLRVLRGSGLPEGWVGKPHACHRLAAAAAGEVLVFVDADTILTSGGARRLVGLARDLKADVVSAMPRQLVGSFFERLVVPLLHLTYVSWFPLVLTWRSKDARFLAANGQVLAVRRAAYDAVGGFAAVRTEVVDDMAFCRLVKRSGRRVVFADGFEIARCRMYRSARGVLEGFSKNLYEGIGARWYALVIVLCLYGAAFVVPYLLLAGAIFFDIPGAALPAALGVVANVLIRAALALRFDHPVEGVVLHPLGVIAFFYIAIRSAVVHARGAIVWAGRTYAKADARRVGTGAVPVSGGPHE